MQGSNSFKIKWLSDIQEDLTIREIRFKIRFSERPDLAGMGPDKINQGFIRTINSRLLEGDIIIYLVKVVVIGLMNGN